METSWSCISVILLSLFLIACKEREPDRYLQSLPGKGKMISPIESLDLEKFDIYFPRNVLKIGDCLAMSEYNGTYNLTILDPLNDRKFELFRKGRGPGEMVNASSLHERNNRAILYDRTSSCCVSVDIVSSLNDRSPMLDTLAVFGEFASRPSRLCYADEVFISSDVLSPKSWYCSYDIGGNVLSKVKTIGFNVLQGCDDDFMSSLHLSSVYTADPSSSRVCVANVASATLSFSRLENGVLTEYKRYEITPPEISFRGRFAVNSPDSIDSFHDIDSDDDYVYLLYSGRKTFNKESIPSFECNHLLVYDWDGLPVEHFELSHNVSSIHVVGSRVYCGTSYPHAQILVYELK